MNSLFVVEPLNLMQDIVNKSDNTDISLSVVFEWLTPLRHIWEVPVSNLGPKTSYPY
jgi:hypothetical protein